MKAFLSTFLLSTIAASGYCDTNEKTSSKEMSPPPVIFKCCPETSSCCGMRYEVFGKYLYLQPNGSDLYYGAQAIGLNPDVAIPAISPSWKSLEIDPDYHSAFDVGLGLLFDNADVNIMIDWERLHSHDNESFSAPSSAGNMVGPYFDIGPNSENYRNANGKAVFHFDAVNVDFGGQFCFFKRLHTNVYAGAGFARIKQSLQSKFSNIADTVSRKIKTSSTFTGAGPQFGLDYDYLIGKNFYFNGSTVASLLMGQLKNHTTFTTFTPELTTLGVAQPNNQKTSVPNRTQLVPAFEQQLGFSYLAKINCVELNIAIGYQCQIYLNAVQTTDMTSPQVLPSGAVFTPEVGVFAVGFERTLSNFILTGPYASLDIKF